MELKTEMIERVLAVEHVGRVPVLPQAAVEAAKVRASNEPVVSPYDVELTRAMSWIGEQPNSIFLGQNVVHPASQLHASYAGVPAAKRIEMPVAEDLQMGLSLGLALSGLVPLSSYNRMDFLLLALNQLVNHIDKLPEMSAGSIAPKVLIRCRVGNRSPVDPGPQHCQDHTAALRCMLRHVHVVDLQTPAQIFPAYQKAWYAEGQSTVLVEHTL